MQIQRLDDALKVNLRGVFRCVLDERAILPRSLQAAKGIREADILARDQNEILLADGNAGPAVLSEQSIGPDQHVKFLILHLLNQRIDRSGLDENVAHRVLERLDQPGSDRNGQLLGESEPQVRAFEISACVPIVKAVCSAQQPQAFIEQLLPDRRQAQRPHVMHEKLKTQLVFQLDQGLRNRGRRHSELLRRLVDVFELCNLAEDAQKFQIQTCSSHRSPGEKEKTAKLTACNCMRERKRSSKRNLIFDQDFDCQTADGQRERTCPFSLAIRRGGGDSPPHREALPTRALQGLRWRAGPCPRGTRGTRRRPWRCSSPGRPRQTA